MSKALKIAVANVKQQIAGKLYLKSGTDFTRPVQVYCLLTYRCNARCKMCDHWRMEKYPEELPAEVWIEALSDLKKLSPGAHVQFTGGEVLMKKDFLDILQWCGDNDLSAGMVTNAGLITPEIAAQIVHCRPNNVNISIDSPYAEVHDDLRGRAGFLEKVIAAIGYLRKEAEEQDTKLAISIKPTLSRLNIESMPELLKKAVEWGATMVNIQPLTVRTDDVIGMDISGYEGAGKIFDKLIEMKESGFPLANSRRQFDLWLKSGCVTEAVPQKCTVGLRMLEILSDGKVQFCNLLPTVIGNIREDKISEIWKSPLARETRRRTVECKRNCTASCYVSRTFTEKISFFWRSFVKK